MSTLKKCLLFVVFLCFCLTLWSKPAYALIPLQDQFIAGEACEALQSIREQTNPENIRLVPQETYPVIGKNRDNASHYMLKIEGTKPPARWVPVQCGQLLSSSTQSNQASLLALSWQPSFCETKPSKPECQS